MEFEKVRDVIADQFNISPESITERMSFKDDLNADSLDVFQLVTALEEEFEIEFDSDDADKIKTVGDAVEYIKKISI